MVPPPDMRAGGAALAAMRRGLRWSAALLAALAGAMLHPAPIQTLIHARVIWPTERVMEAAAPLAAARGGAAPHLTDWGDEEPSPVWRAGRDTRLICGDEPLPSALPAALLADPCAVIAADRGRLSQPIPPGMAQHALAPAFSLGAGRTVDLVQLQPD